MFCGLLDLYVCCGIERIKASNYSFIIVSVENNMIQQPFDRDYISTTLDGQTYTFKHFLIASAESLTQLELEAKYAVVNANARDCSFAGGGEAKELRFHEEHDQIDKFLALFNDAVGEGYAMQDVLKRCAKDFKNTLTKRVSAIYLSTWIGSNDLSSTFLIENAPWAAAFLRQLFEEYPPIDSCSTSLLEYYSIATFSLNYFLSSSIDSSAAIKTVPAEISKMNSGMLFIEFSRYEFLFCFRSR